MSADDRKRDRAIWEGIFQSIPPAWFEAPPSDAMLLAREFFTHHSCPRLLDVGCGFGRWALFLSDLTRVVGTDFAPSGLRAGSRSMKTTPARPFLVAGDAISLPFRDDTFDGILAALVLDNASREDAATAVRELSRVAKPASHGLFVFNPYETDEQMAADEGDNPTKDCTHVAYADDELSGCLTGWSVERVGVSREGFRLVETVLER